MTPPDFARIGIAAVHPITGAWAADLFTLWWGLGIMFCLVGALFSAIQCEDRHVQIDGRRLTPEAGAVLGLLGGAFWPLALAVVVVVGSIFLIRAIVLGGRDLGRIAWSFVPPRAAKSNLPRAEVRK